MNCVISSQYYLSWFVICVISSQYYLNWFIICVITSQYYLSWFVICIISSQHYLNWFGICVISSEYYINWFVICYFISVLSKLVRNLCYFIWRDQSNVSSIVSFFVAVFCLTVTRTRIMNLVLLFQYISCRAYCLQHKWCCLACACGTTDDNYRMQHKSCCHACACGTTDDIKCITYHVVLELFRRQRWGNFW